MIKCQANVKNRVYKIFLILLRLHTVECASLSKYTSLAVSACTMSSGLCFKALNLLARALLYAHRPHRPCVRTSMNPPDDETAGPLWNVDDRSILWALVYMNVCMCNIFVLHIGSRGSNHGNTWTHRSKGQYFHLYF